MCNPNIAISNKKPRVLSYELSQFHQKAATATAAAQERGSNNGGFNGRAGAATTPFFNPYQTSFFSMSPPLQQQQQAQTISDSSTNASVSSGSNGNLSANTSPTMSSMPRAQCAPMSALNVDLNVGPSIPQNIYPGMWQSSPMGSSLPPTGSLASPLDGSSSCGGATSRALPQQHMLDPQLSSNCGLEKTKPKRRRRKPSKPGKTAKNQERHFVVHNYHDHADDPDTPTEEKKTARKGGASVSFPMKLHAVLGQVEREGLTHVVSWQPHGRCFVIHKPKEFVSYIMPKYFRQTKLTSFQRQLNLYGFNRLTRGADEGGYYNEYFLRGRQHLCKHLVRTKVKGTRFKAASNPENEPNFYSMKPVPQASVAPHLEVSPPVPKSSCPTDTLLPPDVVHPVSPSTLVRASNGFADVLSGANKMSFLNSNAALVTSAQNQLRTDQLTSAPFGCAAPTQQQQLQLNQAASINSCGLSNLNANSNNNNAQVTANNMYGLNLVGSPTAQASFPDASTPAQVRNAGDAFDQAIEDIFVGVGNNIVQFQSQTPTSNAAAANNSNDVLDFMSSFDLGGLGNTEDDIDDIQMGDMLGAMLEGF